MWQPYLFLSGCCLAKEIRSLLDTSWWDSCFNQFSCGRGWGGLHHSQRTKMMNQSLVSCFFLLPLVLWCQQRKIKGVKVMPSLVQTSKKVQGIFIVNPKFLVQNSGMLWLGSCRPKSLDVAGNVWQHWLSEWLVGVHGHGSPARQPGQGVSMCKVHATCVVIPKNSVDNYVNCPVGQSFVGCATYSLEFLPQEATHFFDSTQKVLGGAHGDLNIDGQCMLMQRLGNEVCESSLNSLFSTVLTYIERFIYSCPFAWILCENKRVFGCGAGQRFSQGEYWWDLQETPEIPEKFQTTTRKTTTMCL